MLRAMLNLHFLQLFSEIQVQANAARYLKIKDQINDRLRVLASLYLIWETLVTKQQTERVFYNKSKHL